MTIEAPSVNFRKGDAARMRQLSFQGYRFIVKGISLLLLLWPTAAIASERVILKYKIFRESIEVDELTALAETGEVSPALQSYLDYGNQDPQAFRETLTREIDINVILLDRALNNPIGGFILDQTSQVVHTPSGKANRQALRAALVLSASQDNTVSLIEIIQNYPTPEVIVEGDRIVAAYKQLKALEAWIPRLTGSIDKSLQQNSALRRMC